MMWQFAVQFSLYYSLEIKVRESNCQRLIQRGYLMLCKESPNHVRHVCDH